MFHYTEMELMRCRISLAKFGFLVLLEQFSLKKNILYCSKLEVFITVSNLSVRYNAQVGGFEFFSELVN